MGDMPAQLLGVAAQAGVLGIVLWWLTTRLIPKLQEENKEARTEFLAALKQERGEFLEALREEREANQLLAKTVQATNSSLEEHRRWSQDAHAQLREDIAKSS